MSLENIMLSETSHLEKYCMFNLHVGSNELKKH